MPPSPAHMRSSIHRQQQQQVTPATAPIAQGRSTAPLPRHTQATASPQFAQAWVLWSDRYNQAADGTHTLATMSRLEVVSNPEELSTALAAPQASYPPAELSSTHLFREGIAPLYRCNRRGGHFDLPFPLSSPLPVVSLRGANRRASPSPQLAPVAQRVDAETVPALWLSVALAAAEDHFPFAEEVTGVTLFRSAEGTALFLKLWVRDSRRWPVVTAIRTHFLTLLGLHKDTFVPFRAHRFLRTGGARRGGGSRSPTDDSASSVSSSADPASQYGQTTGAEDSQYSTPEFAPYDETATTSDDHQHHHQQAYMHMQSFASVPYMSLEDDIPQFPVSPVTVNHHHHPTNQQQQIRAYTADIYQENLVYTHNAYANTNVHPYQSHAHQQWHGGAVHHLHRSGFQGQEEPALMIQSRSRTPSPLTPTHVTLPVPAPIPIPNPVIPVVSVPAKSCPIPSPQAPTARQPDFPFCRIMFLGATPFTGGRRATTETEQP